MKTIVGTLVLLGAALTSGLAVAQTPPPHRSGPATAEPRNETDQTRAQLNSSGAVIAAETLALPSTQAGPEQGSACVPNSTGGGSQSRGTAAAPVNGIGGVGGGRFSFKPCGIINNSETDPGAAVSRPAPGSASPDRAANRDHIDQDAQTDTRAAPGFNTDSGATPVNGIGGSHGGRTSNRGQSGNGETRPTVRSSGGTTDVLAWSWGRIDRVNTVQACTARRGEVVMHQGIQQCRLPATTRSDDVNGAFGQVSTTR